MNKKKLLLTLLAAFGLLAAACGSSTDTSTDAVDDTAGETEEVAEDEAAEEVAEDEAAMEDEVHSMPGEGVEVAMGRADWSTGYFHAEIFRQLLGELGYDVSDPADLELSPSLAYLAMAEGDFDFWANSWYPGHNSWLKNDLPDGSAVGDHLSTVGAAMPAAGLQGYLVTRSVADELGITTIDQIAADADLTAAFDSDGDGKAEIYGCPESWTCDNIITEQMCQYGWDEAFTQVQAGYDAMIAEAIAKADAGEAMIIYTWSPSAYTAQLRPGDNVYWIGVENETTDVNCAEQENGEEYVQPNMVAAIGEDQCPSVKDFGECRLGWTAADILVTANTEFLDANPAAAALLDAFVISPIDVSLANLEQANTDGSSEAIGGIAAEWIVNNRDTADAWLDTARAAS